MTPQVRHDTPLIPLEQELGFGEGVAVTEARDLACGELLLRAAAWERAAAAAPSPAASSAAAARRRQRYAHQALVYRRTVNERHSRA